MEIRWLGHSCFKLEESTGTSVVTDPYSDTIVGYEMVPVTADVITISHDHDDHNNLDNIVGNPQVINTIGAFEVDGIYISSLRSFHDNKKGAKRGENRIFKFRMDGVEICHMGDIGEEPRLAVIESIGAVNILLIPVGGKYTIDAKQAKEYVDLLMPDIVIPMHYKTRDCKVDIDKVDEFLELFDENDIIYLDTDRIEFDRADFDGEQTKVLVFERQE